MKHSMLIHRMADWLDRKYLRPNTWSERASRACPSGPWYSQMASSDRAATDSISLASGRQNQPSQIRPGTAPIRMPFSYTSIARW